MSTNAESHVTTDHEEIRKWAEKREGHPACVKGTGGEGDVGMLRIDFPGYSGEESLQHICWEDWFAKFDERGLALLFQEKTAGGAESNFNKLVSRETAEEVEEGRHTSSHRSTSSSRTSSSSGSKSKSSGGSKKQKTAH